MFANVRFRRVALATSRALFLPPIRVHPRSSAVPPLPHGITKRTHSSLRSTSIDVTNVTQCYAFKCALDPSQPSQPSPPQPLAPRYTAQAPPPRALPPGIRLFTPSCAPSWKTCPTTNQKFPSRPLRAAPLGPCGLEHHLRGS